MYTQMIFFSYFKSLDLYLIMDDQLRMNLRPDNHDLCLA